MSEIEKQDDSRGELVTARGPDGYLLDASKPGMKEGLQLSQDQHNILIPQPSVDPHDPLNWSQGRKNLILIIISATAFLADYGSATGAVTLIPQAQSVINGNDLDESFADWKLIVSGR